MSEREFKNPFPDYEEAFEIFDSNTGKLSDVLLTTIQEKVDELVKKLKVEKQLAADNDFADTSIYTGSSGIALANLHYLDAKSQGNNDHLEEVLSNVLPLLSYLKKRRFSYLCGAAGPMVMVAVLYYRMGMEKESACIARRIENAYTEVCSVTNATPDELLYGKAGFLFALLHLNKHVERSEFRDTAIQEVVNSIIVSGQRLSKRFKNTDKVPLYYEWKDKVYVGAAHGFIGILCMLLKAKDYLPQEQLEQLVRPTIDFVLSLQFPSGNFPSSLGNNTDRLVHWCHGAAGAVYLLLLAYEVFQDDKYLEAARRCDDCIWERGLLKKGYGLCHGVSGNGYAHLRMFQVTKEAKYLYRAIKFAEWMFDYGKHGCRNPDRPLSLFEGLAGTIYFLVDVMDPLNAMFPGFQL